MDQIRRLLAQPALMALAIIAGSIIVAYLIEFVISRTLVVLARKTKTDLDDRIIDILRRPIFLSVIFGGLSVAATSLQLPDAGAAVVDGGLKSIAIVVWAMAIIRIGSLLLHVAGDSSRPASLLQPATVPVFDILAKVIIVGGAVYLIFVAWNVDLTAWLASAGILGIAVGFAAKDTLANFFSGVFILADAPYKLGDFIVIDGSLRGEVTNIGMRSTRILTRDDVQITVPNAVIGNAQIMNEVAGPHTKQRIQIQVEAAYGSDIDQVREVLVGCGEGVAHVATEPRPTMRFRKFGASGLELTLLVWLENPAMRGMVIDEINVRIYKRFAEAGIEIPFSKHDVYLKGLG